MNCPCCNDAKEWPGTVAARTYTPACLWCGARYIRLTPGHGRNTDGRPLTRNEATTEMRRILADWVAHGHSEMEIRRLVKLDGLPLAPESSGGRAKRGD